MLENGAAFPVIDILCTSLTVWFMYRQQPNGRYRLVLKWLNESVCFTGHLAQNYIKVATDISLIHSRPFKTPMWNLSCRSLPAARACSQLSIRATVYKRSP